MIYGSTYAEDFKPDLGESKLSTGAIVGIVVACCLFVLLILLAIFFYLRKKNKEKNGKTVKEMVCCVISLIFCYFGADFVLFLSISLMYILISHFLSRTRRLGPADWPFQFETDKICNWDEE